MDPRSPCASLLTPMQTRIIMCIYGKPRSSRRKLTHLPHKPELCNWNSNFRLRLHHVKVFALVPTAIIQNCLGSDSNPTAHRSVSFGFAIILQHYDTTLNCTFCVLSCCHVFSFIDVLLPSYYILPLPDDYIKQCC